MGRAGDDAARSVPRLRRRPCPQTQAVGRIAAESLATYPPGIPNVLPGERLTAETLAYVQRTLELGGSVRGASDRLLHTVRVVVEDGSRGRGGSLKPRRWDARRGDSLRGAVRNRCSRTPDRGGRARCAGSGRAAVPSAR